MTPDDPFRPPRTLSRHVPPRMPAADIAVAGLGVSMVTLIASAIVAPDWPAVPLAMAAVLFLVVLALWRSFRRR